MAMCLSFVSLATSLSLFRSLGDRCTDNAIYQPSASDNVLHPAIDDISRRACAIVQSSLTGLLSLESPTCGCQRTCFLFTHQPRSSVSDPHFVETQPQRPLISCGQARTHQGACALAPFLQTSKRPPIHRGSTSTFGSTAARQAARLCRSRAHTLRVQGKKEGKRRHSS
jgi:hypothetical protein